MAWDHLSITKPHLVYIILGGFTTLFMLCSSIIKERMYIGEATVATICGIIFGPHAANLIDPKSWGNVDLVTIEFSRIVLVVQCFAVGVELPKFYMEKHWRSVTLLLIPVMTIGWLIVSLFIWWLIDPLSWLESLVIAACVTATDPVLASSVVGKGKFAKRVPKHLRDLLSAESGCNDGMAFPFVYLGIYLIQEHMDAKATTFHWIVYTILYECIFGAIFGFVVGYIARHGIKYAEEHDLIDRESFLVFYFVLALFCAGAGSLLGMDDLLVGFAAGVGFSNDGWFASRTEESHVSNVIDLLINLAYFVFLGTIIPWEQYNMVAEGITPWRLVVIAIFVILFRRIPAMLILKPFIPDIKTWREAIFAGHFGPIGVGAIFVAILARAELQWETPVPLSDTPPEEIEHRTLVAVIWPIVTFLVISSIIVHGSSVAVFTLGKRINTLTITMSYTTAPEDGPTWMNRLPRISSQSRSQARTISDTDGDEVKMPEFPPGTLPPVGFPGAFLRRQKDEDGSKSRPRSTSRSRRKKNNKWDDGIGPGGPVSQSAIFPTRREPLLNEKDPASPDGDGVTPPRRDSDRGRSRDLTEKDDDEITPSPEGGSSGTETPPKIQIYEEGKNLVVENEDGEVLTVERSESKAMAVADAEAHHRLPVETDLAAMAVAKAKQGEKFNWTLDSFKRKVEDVYTSEVEKRKEKSKADRRHEPARAFQFGNTIIVEDEDGEVIKTYELPSSKTGREPGGRTQQSLKYLGMGGLLKASEKPVAQGATAGESSAEGAANAPLPKSGWQRYLGGSAGAAQKPKKNAAEGQQEDDRHIRFTIGGVGQRMTKEDFIREVQKLDDKTRRQVVDQSTASQRVKSIAKGDVPSPADQHANIPTIRIGSDSAEKRSGSYTPQRVHSGAAQPPAVRASREEEADEADEEETAIERHRRLDVLSNQSDEDVDSAETPAERRRREAALGMNENDGGDDSDDEGGERVPPTRRGIRFAESTVPRGQK
ncbi:putative Na(+)/H(+) antiporter C3A11.09 [Colletotrichum tanaceti]|uniref:Putative Na(+)/H(+) antiporter C3A11.09 n=1 Tax=Colletotrichum tanaceti TaxID=1306861 RepID=A0A4V6DFX3_9PEZI|nr:putative Na(+)/H(+) antiporter C3A11.09 [Colletotrichum tanaceti]TKW50726.1 putative Na(+)/H(+) antiporter C3A11.09 [Colletotrichum tanaceti]